MTAETVILASGDFPRRGGEAYGILMSAKRVICCDSAGDAYRRETGREPYAVIGDCDSVKGDFETLIRVDDQDTNDLAKAVEFCRAEGWTSPVILGATGKRDDHTVGNIFRALEYGLDVVTDFGRFTALDGSGEYAPGKGASVSVFATERDTAMTSEGLCWPLDGVVFANLYCATLNRASADVVKLTTNRRVFLYFAFHENSSSQRQPEEG